MRKAKRPAKVQICYLIGKFGIIERYVQFGWPERTVVVIDYAGNTNDLERVLRGRRLKQDHIGISFSRDNCRYCDNAGDIAVVMCKSEHAAKNFVHKLTPVCPVYIFKHGRCVYHSDPKDGMEGPGTQAHY